MPWLLHLLGGRGEQRRRRLPIGRACAENPLIGVVGCGHRPAESEEKAARYRLAPCAHCGVFATPNCGCILFGAHGCGKARDSHPIPTCPDPKNFYFRAENRFQYKQVLSLGRARQQLLIFIFMTLFINDLKNHKIPRNGRFSEPSPESLSNSKTAQNRPPQVRDSRRFSKPHSIKIHPISRPKNPNFCAPFAAQSSRKKSAARAEQEKLHYPAPTFRTSRPIFGIFAPFVRSAPPNSARLKINKQKKTRGTPQVFKKLVVVGTGFEPVNSKAERIYSPRPLATWIPYQH